MKKPTVTHLATVLSSLFLTACSGKFVDDGSLSSEPENSFQPVEQDVDPIAAMVLRVVGYGAMIPDKSLTEYKVA
jgi:PBP1b-binding outer membrane lipoprotein LpoB